MNYLLKAWNMIRNLDTIWYFKNIHISGLPAYHLTLGRNTIWKPMKQLFSFAQIYFKLTLQY
jgi:hypothetical protein